SRGARGRAFRPRHVECRPPAALVILSQLQIVAFTVHPTAVLNPGPRVKPRAEGVQGAVVGGERAANPSAALRSWPRWAEHGYSITWSARPSTGGGIFRPSAFAVLRLITSSNLVGCSTGRSAGLAT